MMAIIKSCCFGAKTLRSGSFASGIYTLALYTLFVTIGAFHVNLVIHITVLFILSVLLLLFSGLCVMTSVILLVGLCVDNRKMLIPWMVVVPMTITLHILICCFIISDEETIFDGVIWILLGSDISMCFLNLYCVLCVYSQYQEYLEGRGGPEGDQRRRSEHDFVMIAPIFLYKPKDTQHKQQQNIELDEDFERDGDTHSTSQSNPTSFVTSRASVSNDQNANISVNDIDSGLLYNKEIDKKLFYSKTLPSVGINYHLNKQFNLKPIPLTI